MPPPRLNLRFRLLHLARWVLAIAFILALVIALLSTNWIFVYETERRHVWAGWGEIVSYSGERMSTCFDANGFHVIPRVGTPLRLSKPVSRTLSLGTHQLVLPMWLVLVMLLVAMALLSGIDSHSIVRRTVRLRSDGRATLRWSGIALFTLLVLGWLTSQAGHRVSIAAGKTELFLCDRLRFGVARHNSTAFRRDATGRKRRILTAPAYAAEPEWTRRLGLVGIEFLREYNLTQRLPWMTQSTLDRIANANANTGYGNSLSTARFEATLAVASAYDAGWIDRGERVGTVFSLAPEDPHEIQRGFAEVEIAYRSGSNLAEYLNRPLPIAPPQGPGSELVRITTTSLLIPYWLPMLLVFIPTCLLWYRRLRARPGHCDLCGYNLTGLTSDKCPECGTLHEHGKKTISTIGIAS